MEKQLREHLMQDEELLWTGYPEPFDTLDKTNKKSIVTGLVIKTAVAVGILAAYLTHIPENAGVMPGVVIFLLVMYAFAMASPFLIAGRLRKKTIYGLTDKRIIRSGASDQAVPYERIKSAALRTDEDGHTSLLCGSWATGLKSRKWRGEADAPFHDSDDEPEAERVVLYALPMDDVLESLLKKYLPLE